MAYKRLRHVGMRKVKMDFEFFVSLSVVFKKFGLVFNEFLPVVDCLFHMGIINLSFDSYVFYFSDVGFNILGDSICFILSFF